MTDPRKMMGDALRVKRLGPGAYVFVDRDGIVRAEADKTGTHLDNYPWSYLIGFDTEPHANGRARRTTAAAESLRYCKYAIEDAWAHRVLGDDGRPVAHGAFGGTVEDARRERAEAHAAAYPPGGAS